MLVLALLLGRVLGQIRPLPILQRGLRAMRSKFSLPWGSSSWYSRHRSTSRFRSPLKSRSTLAVDATKQNNKSCGRGESRPSRCTSVRKAPGGTTLPGPRRVSNRFRVAGRALARGDGRRLRRMTPNRSTSLLPRLKPKSRINCPPYRDHSITTRRDCVPYLSRVRSVTKDHEYE